MPDYDRLPGQIRPLLGASCPSCGALWRSDPSGEWSSGCTCSGAPASAWMHRGDDLREWYRDAPDQTWRALSSAEARMKHAREAQASFTVRRTSGG